MAVTGVKNVHFIGIGGAGMAPLAGLFHRDGILVSGSDLEFSAKCAALRESGIPVEIGHDCKNVPPATALAIVSSAIPANNPEVCQCRINKIPLLRRGEALAKFAGSYRRVAAISGTHGKSSITAALTAILTRCGKAPGFMIGAEIDGGESFDCGLGRDIFVTEADESDGTHTFLHPALGIVPNVEDDHAWSVGGREALEKNFRSFAANSEKLIYLASPLCDRLFADHPNAERIAEVPANFAGLTGFQAVNAYIACRSAILLGCDPAAAEAAAADYPQVKRRMSCHWETPELTLIEDYAHHPTELRRSLEFLRSKYPNHRLTVVFQPHRFARLERYFTDFVRELAVADTVFITPVFAAWSETGKISAADLAAQLDATLLPRSWSESAGKIIATLEERPTVIAILGAGDIAGILPELTVKLAGR